jgi:hypothetical protein
MIPGLVNSLGWLGVKMYCFYNRSLFLFFLALFVFFFLLPLATEFNLVFFAALCSTTSVLEEEEEEEEDEEDDEEITLLLKEEEDASFPEPGFKA